MSHLGATLQTYNEELVNLIEDLRVKLEDVEGAITKDEKQKAVLLAQIEDLTRNLELINLSLNEKIALKDGYSQTLNEAETAYMKILESSQMLIAVVKKKSSMLEEKVVTT